MFKENQKIFIMSLRCCDLLIELGAMLLAYWVRFSLLSGDPEHFGLDYYLWMLAFSIPVYILLYNLLELYEMFHYHSMVNESAKVICANFFGAAFLFLFSFFQRSVDVSRLLVVLFALFNTFFGVALRICIRWTLRSWRRQGKNLTRVLIAGWNSVSGDFYDKITNDRDFGYTVVGYVSDCRCQTGGRDLPFLGELKQLGELLQAHVADEVVISLDAEEFKLLGGIIEVCEREGVKSSLLPFYAQYLPTRPYVDELDGMPLINLRRIPLDNLFNRFLKRSVDLVGALCLILILSPLMLVVAVCVKLFSPGPIIYRQERIGRNKRPFVMYKFRSMQVAGNEDMTTWGTRDDRRRTRFGTFIRKFSIDELPQLFNVVKGDMSLVGPRPERPFFVEKFREEVPLYMLKHLVRPGITGWAQVNGWRGDTSILERVKCDMFYIENWSFLLDIKILCLTLVRGIVNPSEDL